MAFYLSSDHDSPGNERHVGILLESVVESDDVQDVEQLTFVLVNALHLNIEHCRRVNLDPVIVLNNASQTHFVLLI